MNVQELEKLKADIKAEVLKEITGKGYQTSGSKLGVYDEIREKYKKPLLEAYGVYHFNQVWQMIRRLACYKAGVRYVRDLTPSKEVEAADFAEMLCKIMLEGKVKADE